MESQIQYPPVNLMQIHKPKKNGSNSYLCSIFLEKKRNSYIICIKNTKILKLSELSTPGDSYLYLIPKSRADFNNLYDINEKIVDIVKENSESWFNNNMNLELIDDYYTSTLIYDKSYGDIIKLKIVGSLYSEIKELDKNKFYDFKVTLLQLRFFKQKFVLETSIDAYQESSAICFINDSDSEVHEDPIDTEVEVDVSPSHEEIEMMRQEMMDKYSKVIKEFDDKYDKVTNELNDKISEKKIIELDREKFLEKRKTLENLADENEILRLCGEELRE